MKRSVSMSFIICGLFPARTGEEAQTTAIIAMHPALPGRAHSTPREQQFTAPGAQVPLGVVNGALSSKMELLDVPQLSFA